MTETGSRKRKLFFDILCYIFTKIENFSRTRNRHNETARAQSRVKTDRRLREQEKFVPDFGACLRW